MDFLDAIWIRNMDSSFAVDFRILENNSRALEWGRLRSINNFIIAVAINRHRRK